MGTSRAAVVVGGCGLAVAGTHSMLNLLHDTVDILHVVGVFLILVGSSDVVVHPKICCRFCWDFFGFLFFGFF